MPDWEIDIELLISLVEDNRILWDKNLDEYKNAKLTTAAWRNVCHRLIENFEHLDNEDRSEIGKLVKKKWANLRDAWLKYMKKQKEVKRTKKYVYHDQMNFLATIYGTPFNLNFEDFSQQSSLFEETAEWDSEGSGDVYIDDPSSDNIEDNKPIIVDDKAVIMVPGTSQTPKKRRIAEETASEQSEENNRHMLFFRGVLPSVVEFSEDQTIDFQMGVLNLIKSIKRTQYST